MNSMKHIILFFFFSLFYSLPVNAVPNILINHYSTDIGLPNNSVSCILKDRDGFMWFGTWYGLCRYDGYFCKRYTEVNLPLVEMPPRKIQTLVEDRNGLLWIKTVDRKLYTFNKKKETFRFINDRMKSMSGNIQIIKIQLNQDGNVLILTKDKSLFLAFSDEEGNVDIEQVCGVRKEDMTIDLRLKKNILSENDKSVSWIGQDFKILLVEKDSALYSKGHVLIRQLQEDSSIEHTAVFQQGKVLWIGDSKGNVSTINLGSGLVSHYILPEIQKPINALVVEGHLLFLTTSDNRLYCYDLEAQRLKGLPVAWGDAKVISLLCYGKEYLWIETSRSLTLYNYKNGTIHTYKYEAVNDIRSLEIRYKKDGHAFVLTSRGEAWMIFLPTGELYPINQLQSIHDLAPSQIFSDLQYDEEDGIWLSSMDNGVYSLHFPANQFRFLDTEVFFGREKGQPDGIRALYQTKDGRIWVGTRWRSLYCLDTERKLLHHFSKDNYEIGNVYHILEDYKGNLWLSTKGDGLVKGVPDKSQPAGYRFVRYSYKSDDVSSISSNSVYYVFEDSRHRVWIATLGGGLNLYEERDGKEFFYNLRNGFSDYPDYGQYCEVRTIIENEGRIWVGTMDGLMSFDVDFKSPESIDFEIYRGKKYNGLAENDVYTLYSDRSSQIWGSVFGGGVFRLDKYDSTQHIPHFISYGEKDGLNNSVVMSIVEDDNQNMWLATENGLSCFNKQSEKFTNIDRYDGFPDVELEESSILYTAGGELWLGARKGIVVFKPDQIRSVGLHARTYVVNFSVSNEELEVGKDIPSAMPYVDKVILTHEQSMFNIEFATLNYAEPSIVTYRYILDGYESEWHDNGSNCMASYTNVPPGKYTFTVQAIDRTASNLISERNLAIVVLPPWWATWWAYLIYSLIGLGVLSLIVRTALLFIRMKNNVYIEQRLSELKIKFFTNISHELRTPLTLIKGPIQELKEKETLSEKGKQYIFLMERSTQQMLQLVNQILDFRKIQNGKMRLHVSAVRLSDVLGKVCREFKVLSEETDINFETSFVSSDVVIWVDEDKFCTVIRNVISNAFKYTSAGGWIRVSVEVDEADSTCKISISDDGVGIPKDKLVEIFERFSQANTDKTPYKGTGIGLALSKELVLMHHGDIHAQSDGIKGATFVITIPLGKDHFKDSEVDFYVGNIVEFPEGIPMEEASDEEEDIDKKNSLPSILLVEDNKDLCQMLKMQLEDRFKVYMASDGAEGLKKVLQYHPDLVVTDQMMPEMDGMELLEHIRADFQTSHIPVIMLTAKNNDEMKSKAYAAGANAYITKPFSKDLLITRIEQLLNDRRHLVEQICQSAAVLSETKTNYEQLLEKKDVELLERVHQVIEDNLDNADFNIDSIAQSIGLSRSAFFKKIKGLTGLAPVDLVKEIRLNKSVDLIKNTDLTISEIAFTVGFKDAGYFGKCFRKKFNQTPRDYMAVWRKSL